MSYKTSPAYVNILAAINVGKGTHTELAQWQYVMDGYGKTLEQHQSILFMVDFKNLADFDRFYQTLGKSATGQTLEINVSQDNLGVHASFSLPI
ncbi:MAG: hypothetical protein ACLPY5_14370 [Candidatus Bathyarchaeia archaeon]